uniref:p38K n=1 Tax=Pseudomonas putida TaxID=303 RepID=O69767_PSEPU|nr:P38K [Pseudomonas putida]
MKPRNMRSSFSNREKIRRSFESTEQPLHLIAALVHLAVVVPRFDPRLHWWHHRNETQIQCQLPCLVAFVGTVHQQMHRSAGRPKTAEQAPASGASWPAQARAKTSRPFEHPRQPYESWCSIRLGTFRWTADLFFSAPVPSGWTLMLVESSETASILIRTTCARCNSSNMRIQDASFGPAIHARVNRVPVAEAFGQSAPLATMFGHIEDRIDHLQIAQADVATLPGQAVFNGSELFGRDLHVGDFLAQSSPSPLVLTRPSVRGYRTGENPTRLQGFDQHATRPIQTNYPGASHATIPTHRRWRAFGQRFRRPRPAVRTHGVPCRGVQPDGAADPPATRCGQYR